MFTFHGIYPCYGDISYTFFGISISESNKNQRLYIYISKLVLNGSQESCKRTPNHRERQVWELVILGKYHLRPTSGQELVRHLFEDCDKWIAKLTGLALLALHTYDPLTRVNHQVQHLWIIMLCTSLLFGEIVRRMYITNKTSIYRFCLCLHD